MAPTAIMYRFFAPVLSAQFMLRGDEGAQGRERESARGLTSPRRRAAATPCCRRRLLPRRARETRQRALTPRPRAAPSKCGTAEGAKRRGGGSGRRRRREEQAAARGGRAWRTPANATSSRRNQKTNLLASDQPTPVRHSRAGGEEDAQAAALRNACVRGQACWEFFDTFRFYGVPVARRCRRARSHLQLWAR